MALARLFTSRRALLALACMALAALALMGVRASAQQSSGWQVCNETSYVIETAAARPDGRAVLVQGWTRLRPGECRVAIPAPLERGTYYLYSRTSSAHRGGRQQWGGDAPLCVDPAHSFSFDNPPECANMGMEERLFRRVVISKRDSWRTTFSEAQPYTLARARQQGLQRLLDDAGYDIYANSRGIDPRRIAQAIAQFRAASHLAPNASENQLIDALEVAARHRAEQVGLTLCNRTRGRVWTAVARRRGEGWESRGWWLLNAGGCVRAIDDVLLQQVYYVYASLDNDQGARLLAAGGEPFCTSSARFAILGRENCDARYYDTTLFTPIATRNRQGLVVDFDESDFLEPGQQPRQLAQSQAGPDVVETDQTPRHGLAPPTAHIPSDDRGSGDE
jgi:uncharacterized membrane protein